MPSRVRRKESSYQRTPSFSTTASAGRGAAARGGRGTHADAASAQAPRMRRRTTGPILPQNTGMADGAVLRGLWKSALDAVAPDVLVARWVAGRAAPSRGRTGLFVCGKAAAAMAKGARGLPRD